VLVLVLATETALEEPEAPLMWKGNEYWKMVLSLPRVILIP
jgi:hypothetical protein